MGDHVSGRCEDRTRHVIRRPLDPINFGAYRERLADWARSPELQLHRCGDDDRFNASGPHVVLRSTAQHLVREGRLNTTVEDTGFAAPTAATDGRYVFVMFASGRVAAFDFEGRQVWLKSFGPLDNTYGHSSSLTLFDDRVILQLDHGYADKPAARVLALDAKTGQTAWETAREVDSSWASPAVVRTPSGDAVLSIAPTSVWRSTSGLCKAKSIRN